MSTSCPHLQVVVAIIVAVAVPPGHAQPPPPQRAPGTLTEGVTAVLVDVVVRDRRGQPVKDLSQSDFEVLEDGVPQTIGSFTPVFRDEAEAPAPAARVATVPNAVGVAPPVNPGPTVTALVFDRLSPEGTRLAIKAAENFLGTKEQTPSYLGIFGVDLALTAYAPFTRNGQTLRQALNRVESRASSSFNDAQQRERQAAAEQRAAAAGQTAAAAVSGGGQGGPPQVGTAAGEAQLAMMESRILQEFDVMERDQQGYSTTNGLFAIIGALGQLPGRKSLVLFSEGIAIPPAVQRLFLGVIDSANRANVSIYTMDAAGLRAESEQAKIRDEVNSSARRGIGTGYSAGSGSNAPLTKGLEKNEDVLRQDPKTGLGGLAQDTGGLFFENTNDLGRAFQRIDEDLRNYYLLGYTPANDRFDGRFRTIEVRVKRPGLTVAARKGYFAVRNAGGLPINAWEAPALGALEQKPIPNAFPIRAGALLFPERGRPGLVPVIVDFSTAPITFQSGADGKTYTSDFTVLVRFLDRQNQTVRKVSQHYEVTGPIGEIERANRGEVLFYREPELEPGVYTMETVVHDALSGKASVRFSTVEVPKHGDDALRVSSLVLVKRGEKVPENERRGESPLIVNDVVLYPNIAEPVSRASKEVGFYFAIYPAKSEKAPEAVLELLQNGKVVAQLPMLLPPVGASGRIQQTGRLPIDQLAPGTYELRVIVGQGKERASRTTMLRLE